VTGCHCDLIDLVERSPAHADVVGLLRAFYAEQVSRYGFADSIALGDDQFARPRGVFVVVYDDGGPAGCGGWRWHDVGSRTVEIKKTFVVPASRGRGIGRTLLCWLEREAVAAGAVRAILETGVRNAEALGLFASQGYEPVASYVPGRDPEVNRAFARDFT